MQLTILLLFLIFMGFNQPIYPKHSNKHTPKTQLDQANKPKTRSSQTNQTNHEIVIAPDGDPVAYKILQLFAVSILEFGRLVTDPNNPNNIKSALFNMATCWYQIFTEATKPDHI